MAIGIAAGLGAIFGVISHFYKKAILYLILLGSAFVAFGDKFGLSILPNMKTNRINFHSIDDFFLDIWNAIPMDGRWSILVFPIAAIAGRLVLRFVLNLTEKDPRKVSQARKREVLKGYNLGPNH